MGQACENCGWRENPQNNTGRGCIFTNNKKIWSHNDYNKCGNYVMDTKLKEHLKKLLDSEEREDSHERSGI